MGDSALLVFPPSSTFAAVLPVAAGPLIGRARELAALSQHLTAPGTRLLTLVGPSGSGKTRLALAAAENVRAHFTGGLRFIDLAPLADPALVLPAIRRAFGPRDDTDELLERSLRSAAVASQRVLVILDNFEHLHSAAPLLSNLLSHFPALAFLVTSRQPLQLSWEEQFAVCPLPVPLTGATFQEISVSPSVSLFMLRARAGAPTFELTAENAPAVAELCARLDGLPLALELAAARVKVLGLPTLLERLTRAHESLDLLAGAMQDAAPRHRTLRDAIAWSFDLLDPQERALVARLSVFTGPWSLDAAEAVCAPSRAPTAASETVLEILARLVEKSLVVAEPRPDGTHMFRVLETIAAFGRELLASDELASLALAHSAHYLAIATQAAPALLGTHSPVLHALDSQLGNMLQALRVTVERGSPADALRFVGALWRYLSLRGHLAECERVLEIALDRARALPPYAVPLPLRADVLLGAGSIARTRRRYDAGRAYLQEALELLQHLGDRSGASQALFVLAGISCDLGDYPRARLLYGETLALRRDLDDRAGIAEVLHGLASLAYNQGDLAAARDMHAESLAIRRGLGDTGGAARTLHNLGLVARGRGEWDEAETLLSEALALFSQSSDIWDEAVCLTSLGLVARGREQWDRAEDLFTRTLRMFQEMGDTSGVALSLLNLGRIAAARDDWPAAGDNAADSLALSHRVGIKRHVAAALEFLAALAGARGDFATAAHFFGAAERLRETIGAPLLPVDRAEHVFAVAAARASLDQHTFSEFWTRGREASLDASVTLALRVRRQPSPEQSAPPTIAAPASGDAASAGPPKGAFTSSTPAPAPARPRRESRALTPRELEVAALVAAGLTNRQIAETLVITERTAEAHAEHIRRKLGVRSRAQIAAWAISAGLQGGTAPPPNAQHAPLIPLAAAS